MNRPWLMLFFLVGLMLGGTGCIAAMLDFLAGPTGQSATEVVKGVAVSQLSVGEWVGGGIAGVLGIVMGRLGYMRRQQRKREEAEKDEQSNGKKTKRSSK